MLKVEDVQGITDYCRVLGHSSREAARVFRRPRQRRPQHPHPLRPLTHPHVEVGPIPDLRPFAIAGPAVHRRLKCLHFRSRTTPSLLYLSPFATIFPTAWQYGHLCGLPRPVLNHLTHP